MEEKTYSELLEITKEHGDAVCNQLERGDITPDEFREEWIEIGNSIIFYHQKLNENTNN